MAPAPTKAPEAIWRCAAPAAEEELAEAEEVGLAAEPLSLPPVVLAAEPEPDALEPEEPELSGRTVLPLAAPVVMDVY